MRILFMTLAQVYDLKEHDIYQDLMRCLASRGHDVYIMTGAEKRLGLATELYESGGCHILRVRVGNQSRCGLIEKGISTLTLKNRYLSAAKKYLGGMSFDLILYSTPPITLAPMIKKLKKIHKCKTYLMLKDIFPQNAVDLDMIRKGGLIHRYFLHREKQLYRISDTVGCMSPANVRYLEDRNAASGKLEVFPNALLPLPYEPLSREEWESIRTGYGIPKDRLVLLYGGNLGRPQGIPFLNRCLTAMKDDSRIFTLIVGDGSEYGAIEKNIRDNRITNVKLLEKMPREAYQHLSRIADVGLIFLDHRFTVPNFPSRILPYMENAQPVACAVDPATDMGQIAADNGFGWQCESDSVEAFLTMVEEIKKADLPKMGQLGRAYMEAHYHTHICYDRIMEKQG